MARKVDESKMIRVKAAATELIVQKGYGQASISAIARKAEVAEGYLYRFHASKLDMVNSLLEDKIKSIILKIESLVVNYSSVHKIIEELISDLFQIAHNNVTDIKFLYVLMHDYNFQVNEAQRKKIRMLILKIMELGRASKEVGDLVRPEEVYNLCLMYPIVFINLRLKDFFDNGWSEDDKNTIIDFCKKALTLSK